MKLIYIAGPYRSADPMQVEQNILNARKLAVKIANDGRFFPVTPHLCTGGFEHASTATDEYFLRGTMDLLRACHAMVLIDGWEKSSGTKDEIKTAVDMGMTIFDSSFKRVLAGDHHET